MFIKYTLQEQLLINPQLYTSNLSKALKQIVFQKYLYKINKHGLCVKVDSIDIIDNIILRKTAQMKVKLVINIIVLTLLENEYFEGLVADSDEDGIVVAFVNGLLEGRITIKDLHSDTHYYEQTKEWIMTNTKQQGKCYKWKVGGKARFRISKVLWENMGAKRMNEIIYLKADEYGLGPVDWWI